MILGHPSENRTDLVHGAHEEGGAAQGELEGVHPAGPRLLAPRPADQVRPGQRLCHLNRREPFFDFFVWSSAALEAAPASTMDMFGIVGHRFFL